MLDIKTYILNIAIKLGLKKNIPPTTAINIKNGSNINFKNVQFKGFDVAFKGEQVSDVTFKDTDITNDK